MSLVAQRSSLWLLVSDVLKHNPTCAMWENDSIWLAANWGYCYRDGKHPLTSCADWKVLKRCMQGQYTEEKARDLFFLLCEKRLELFIRLFYSV